ncbi:precorrin-6y C5,15-methyltransferase (decarboxylating) subunit CbiE [Myxococcota bacterium]|nr:precorrin-6y C5,15-methyltransferase (decarboxylating) subunit CbiE [Myxococcota bacterium]
MITVVGVGVGGELPPRSLAAVQAAQTLIGAAKQLALFPGVGDERIDIVGRMGELKELLAARADRRNVVLASGDPLLYGIGVTVLRHFPDAEVLTAPSSVAEAFARVKLSWSDAELISIHGRPMADIGTALDRAGKVAVLTGGENTPAAVGRALGDREGTAYVCERLGAPDERVQTLPIAELAAAVTAEPNVLLLVGPTRPRPVIPHTDDDQFEKKMPKKGLITKREVRTLSLAALGVRVGDLCWDIGAGSGAVAIELALLGAAKVYAVEKNEDACAIVRQNAAAFGALQVEVVHTKAPEGLDALPDPDRVFIGGSGGNIGELVTGALARCRGKLVVNVATIENLADCVSALKAAKARWSVTQVAIGRSSPILDLTRFEALNPVWIVEASR